MSGSLNKVQLIGHLGKDPEIRSFQNDGKAATLSLATSESWKDKETGERKERTDWHRISITTGSPRTRARCGVVGSPSAADIDPFASFFLIVADYDQGFFCVEGPMSDDRPWNNAARHARDNFHRRVVCGPSGPDRDRLAADFPRTEKLGAVPPGSILKPRQ